MKQLDQQVDKWFMEFKTRSIRPKPGAAGRGAMRRPLKPGTGLKNIQSAALKKPEVMVKIPPRKGGSNGIQAVRGHMDYISRNGTLDLEDQDGLIYKGQKQIHEGITNAWKALGVPEKSTKREAINLVLSMPPGTNPEAVKAAAREFAKEEFDGHQYAFVQHLDEKHPHVHLCVMMKHELGRRMDPRKADLFEWRLRFAEKMREQGVDCAATRRVHRGKTQKPEHSALRHMRKRGQVPNVYRQQAIELAQAVKGSTRPIHPFLREEIRTRNIVSTEYGKIAKELYKIGAKAEARVLSGFAKEIKLEGHTTQAQQRFEQAQGQIHEKTREDFSAHDKNIER
ncbi:Relaxase/mobilization nuclease domain containing protein (plasmid) [Advenella kashmirensis WT001]|uniref:Relaxase/mobilization nuclease domain containing protein n=1 Tax=Advenella kashmirensis (strain DSM 17095 / LMG 22695 / WT001) TaxID=1036672 RepID=I3UHY4_ADVKW|nr:relaxase/mobilization nuclease domain-containing protein [Advenella kashmirensis]AFK64622.1 Relaxase/mobilization nuclease domain containing protein [Advenella kashmirensis WT001]